MAIDWDKAYESGRDYKLINVSHLKEILGEASVKPGSAVLDVGCGTGDLVRKLAAEGMKVTGVDLSEVAIAKAKEASGGAGDVTFGVLNVARDEIEAKYDAIFLKLVIAFMEDPKEVLLKIKKALKDGGKIVIITPVRPGEADYSPRYRNISVDYQEFSDLLKGIFDNVKEQNSDYADEFGKEITYIVW